MAKSSVEVVEAIEAEIRTLAHVYPYIYWNWMVVAKKCWSWI